MKNKIDLDEILNTINSELTPISEEIESKLSILTDFLGEDIEYPFTPIQKEDIE